MSDALMKYVEQANLPELSSDQVANALQLAGDDAATDGGGVKYMSFSGKKGTYTLGQDKAEPEGLYIVEPKSITTGWICWKAGKPVDRTEWSIYKPDQAVRESELEDHGPYRENLGEGWFQQLGFGAISIDGGAFGADHIKFSNNSKSGRNAIRDLMEEIRKRVLSGEPSMPVIEFDSVEFTANDQTNFKPQFPVEAWVSREAVAAYLSGEMYADQLIEGEAPPKKKKRSKK